MATPPIAATVLAWGDETPVTLDWTAEPSAISEEDGILDFSLPGNELLPTI